MAQLKDTLVQGSLRVTDTTYTEDLVIQGSKTKNWVLAAPSSANGAPTFRGLDATDIPSLAASKITSGTLPIARGGTGTDDAPTKGGIIYASSTTAYASTGAGTSGQLLQSNAANAPSWITATNANTANTIVKRDASGNFSAGTITAALSGNASTATTLKTAREIYVDLGTTRNTDSKVTFNGGADKAIHVSGILSTGHGGTGVNSHTQNRLVWSNGAGTIQATDNHYASATKVAINSNSEPTENLYVNGSAKISSTTYINGALYEKKTTPIIVLVDTNSSRTDNSFRMNLTIAEDGKQGLWSSGYSNNDKTSFMSSAKWILYRDTDGNSYFKGSATSLETARNLWGNSFDGTASIDGTIKLGDEKEIQFLINRKNTSQTTGWAKPFIKFFGQNETNPFAVMGVYGAKNALNYIYIGTYNYDGNNLRIKADGSIEVPKDTDSTSTDTGAIVTGGGIGIAKSIKVGTQIKFTSTTGLKHIEFSRASGGPSYICYPSNGQLAIGFNTGYDNSIAVFDTNTALRPGKTSTYTLGNSSYRWNDIFSVGGNYSGTITALNLRLTNTQDASGTADNGPALIIGSRTGQHLEIDTNEIMSKKTGTTVDTLYLNANGGTIQLNNASDSYYTQILSLKDGSASEGALRVDGGVSIAKKLHVGETIIGHGGIIYIKRSKSPWPDIQFDTEAGISAEDGYHYTYETVATDGWCQLFAQVPAKRTLTTDNSTLYYSSRFFFRVYSKQANTLTKINFYEDYYLPTANDDRTNNKSYNILTEKSTVTVAQGGTGNTSYTANTLVYAESASKLSSRAALTVGTNQLTLTGPAGADTAIKVTGSINTISLMIGSGNVNRGIYDHTNNKWMIYSDTNNQININSNSYINGKLTLLGNQYEGPGGNIGLDAANSDIIRVNGIYTSDKAELFSEGYLAYRSDTTWDAMAAKDGVFYFGSNVARDAALAGSATLEAGEIISRKANGEGMVMATNGGNHKLYLYCNSDGRSGMYGYTTNGTGYSVFATAAGETSSTFYGNVTGSSASCTGNAATASALSNITSDQSATNVSAALQAFWNAKKDTMPRNKLISFTSSHSGRAIHMGYFITGFNDNPYGGFFTAFYGTPYYSCASNGTFSCYELVRADSRSYSINAATATRINGNLAAATNNTNCNIWISDATPTGVPKYGQGFYYNPSSKTLTVPGPITGTKVYNAVWNDYAECRAVETTDPGYCVTEISEGKMIKTTKRLQAGCKLTSDTYGSCMGETDTAKTPIAVAGRVLAYPYRDRSEYHLGDAVCSAPDGKIDIMTRDEIMMYPERIIGTVSEIPTYEIWQAGSKESPNPVQVNGRIWIYVR